MQSRVVFVVLVMLGACAGQSTRLADEPPVSPSDVAGEPPSFLLGEFVDDYQVHYRVSASTWWQLPNARYHVIAWRRERGYLIAKNDADNPADGGLFTRIDWMEMPAASEYRWAFCMSAYDARSAEAAEQSAAADRAQPKTGCNGFPFSRMRRISDDR